METELRRVRGEGLLALQEFDLIARKGRARNTTVKNRNTLAASLPPGVRDRYERLRAKFQPPWVCRLTDGICPCCRVKLPMRQAQRARAKGEIIVCEHCLRFLIAEPSPRA